MFLSFTSVLPWSHCDNPWNTPNCLDPQLLYAELDNQTKPEACEGFVAANVAKFGKQLCLNGTLRNISDFTPAVEEFWE